MKNPDKLITLNIGPTGHGKTSISEALMWCLYGKNFESKWENWVNGLSIEIAKEKHDEKVDFSVELHLQLNGKNYRIIRSAEYDIKKESRVEESDIVVLEGGAPIKAEPLDFVNQQFLPINLMKYFVFDADNLLSLFEENQERTIKEHINKILDVEILDEIMEVLEVVKENYSDDADKIITEGSSVVSNRLKERKGEIPKKKKAITELQKEIKKIELEMKELFPKDPSETIRNFQKLIEKRNGLEQEIKKLNEDFLLYEYKDRDFPSRVHLILLEQVVEDSLEKIHSSKPTRAQFDTSVEIIRTQIKQLYDGIAYDEKGDVFLIRDTDVLNSEIVDDTAKLTFSEDEHSFGIDQIANPLNVTKTEIQSIQIRFTNLASELEKKLTALAKVRNEINQIGETEKNREDKKKLEDFQKLEKQIDEKEGRIERIRTTIEEIEAEIIKLGMELSLTKEQEKEILSFQERKSRVIEMNKTIEKTKENFMSDLLIEVNDCASQYLRSMVKDSKRFNSVEVSSDYQMVIKQQSGEILEKRQVNLGSLQIALMSFFMALSEHFGKNIPYVIDGPLMRLDSGHDKRLITSISGGNKQIIMHVIPGKEYTSESYTWMRPFINIQNWIDRSDHPGHFESRSYVEPKEIDRKVDYDIDSL